MIVLLSPLRQLGWLCLCVCWLLDEACLSLQQPLPSAGLQKGIVKAFEYEFDTLLRFLECA